jgi:hypothetical protein
MAPYRLIYLLKRAHRTRKIIDYRKAFEFARRKQLLGVVHRWIAFFPDAVKHMIEKGKNTGLPRAILKYPVFNKSAPVYHLRLLGSPVVTRNQETLRAKLSPKETAFFIHLGLRAGEQGKSIFLQDIVDNFWPRSKDATSLLHHLLTDIKKKLRIPRHMLAVSSTSGEPRLLNRGLYITTDYEEIQILFTQSTVLERAGEWRYARRDYLRAFALIKNEPFVKMYDNWSETMRASIINTLEKQSLHFAELCLQHKDEDHAKRVLEKMAHILPQSSSISDLLEEL